MHPKATDFSYTLRPYQQEAHDWLTEHPKSILADDVGLGKSPTATSVLAQHLPALVVAPAYLTQQWFDLLCDALPNASISLPEGARGRRTHELQQDADVRVVSLEMLRTYDMPDVQTLVLDEAHRIRNPKAIQSQKARDLIKHVPRAHLLTATPYYRGDEDIWHLLHCLHPGRYSSYWGFLRDWYVVDWNAPYTPHIFGLSKKKRKEYQHFIRNHMLMRSYRDVGRQLPPLIEETVTFTLPTVLQDTYTRLKKEWQLLGEPVESVGSVYYILRQLTMCHEKQNAVVDIISSIPSEPVVVYTWYKESAHTLLGKLKRGTKDEIPALLLTGDTPPEERARLLANQKRTGFPRVVIATIESLQEGVNMEHIRHVIYAEETYVQGQHHQTISRVRRDRGTRAATPPVIAYYVRARKTIDEVIPRIRNSRGNAGNHELARALAAA